LVAVADLLQVVVQVVVPVVGLHITLRANMELVHQDRDIAAVKLMAVLRMALVAVAALGL
jgi:hypothetical protein